MENQDQRLHDDHLEAEPNANPIAQDQSPYTSIATKPSSVDVDGETLLTVSGLQTAKTSKHSKRLLLVMVSVVAVIIAVTFYVSLGQNSKKTSQGSNSNVSLPTQKNDPLSNGGSINQQVQYCSNVVNANTAC